MKRAIIVVALIVAAVAVFAQEKVTVFEKPFRPASPAVVGQGGSYTANGYGFDSFFTNPALLAGKNSVTLMSVNPWIYSTGEMLQFVSDTAGLGSGEPKELPADWVEIEVTVEFPPDFVLPEGYPGTVADFEQDLQDVFNELVYEAGLTADDLGGTIIIPESWTTMDPTTIEDPSQLAPLMEDFLAANPALADQLANAMLAEVLPPGFPTAPKIRVGVATGLGLIIRGFGLGLAAIFDASIQGGSILSTEGDATFTLGFMGGYAHQFKFTDSLGLRVGGLLRPMFRMNAPVKVAGVLNAFGAGGAFDVDSMMNTMLARYGTGIGIDLGAILDIGPFSVGLAVSDLFDTRFNYRQSGLLALVEEFGDGDDPTLPTGDDPDPTYSYVVPMDVRLGAAFHPDLGALSFLIDPSVHLQVGNFLTVAREAKAAADNGEEYVAQFGDIVAFGAEVRFLRILAVRAGYYQGAVSAGLGAHLLFLDANVSAYIAPREGEVLSGSTGLSQLGDVGLTAEIAIRF